MDRLSLELLETILSCPVLSDRDVLNFSSTCHYFREIVQTSRVIWKQRFYNKWPNLPKDLGCPDWYFDELKYFHSLKTRVLDELKLMHESFFKDLNMLYSNGMKWKVLSYEKERSNCYIRTLLLDVINTKEAINSIVAVPFNTPGNLTLQFSARFILRLLNEHYLKNTWDKFKRLPSQEQTLEKIAIFFAQWFHLDIQDVDNHVAKRLNDIANLVKVRLRSTNPKHPIFTSEVCEWRKKLEKHQWGPENCHEVISTIREVLYSHLGLQGNYSWHPSPEFSFINKVLERRIGLPIVLAVIYESVARRLGVVVEPINYPNHFLLKFQLNQTFYIDTCNGCFIDGVTPCFHQIPVFGETQYSAATTDEIVRRMANNLKFAIGHGDVTERIIHLRLLNRLVTFVGFPLDGDMVTELLPYYTVPENHNRKRTTYLKYAVGMIMIDENSATKCVICDWKGPTHRNNKQPKYLVVFENGVTKFVLQDGITPTTDPGNLQSVEQVGLCFSHFFKNHFVPNEQMENLFPSDAQVRHRFYHEMQLRNYRP
ncbi:F-box only protein 21-like [Tribolium madens]|uniref:F-box only protein 21-like n=1 Tax=Tribolium madens TaxID=41895 RepID=UPI001CF75266|nr:F-box only protein 21-like [Tribolium madens]